MDEGDEFGDLYSDVLQPFQPPAVLPPPSPPLHHLNLRSQYQDAAEVNSASTARVSDEDASKLAPTRQAIGDGGGDDNDMNFDIEEPDAVSTPSIPGLFVTASEAEALPGLATDRGAVQDTAVIEQVGDGGYGGQGEGDDWDSDSEDDFQIVLNESSRNVSIGGDRRSKMGDNEDEDYDDDEPPLIIVNDTDLNQSLEENLCGDGNDGGEAGKGSGPGGPAGLPKTVHNSNGYHPFHSQYKYVRPGAAPMPGGAASTGWTSSAQVRPPTNLGPMAGRGRGDLRPLGMRNASDAQKGFHQPWGSNTTGRGLDFTLPSHKTIFEVDIETFEDKPWRYQGVDITDYFNFGLNEESWKNYCKQLDQHRIGTTMQSRIRVYESGRTHQGYDPDLPPELAAATGASGVPVDSSNLVKPDTAQGDSAQVPTRPSLPPGRPILVEIGSGERLPSIDTRAPRMCDLDAIIEIVCQDSHEDEPSCENGVEKADISLRGEDISVETCYVNSQKPDIESAERSPSQDEPRQRLLQKQDDEISRSTDSGQNFHSSSPIGDRGMRSSNFDLEGLAGEAGKNAEEELKVTSVVPQSAVQEEDGRELKKERSSESSKARSGSQRDYQQLKDGAEDEVIQDKHYAGKASNKEWLDNSAPHQNRKNQNRGNEGKRTQRANKSDRENSNPHMEVDSCYIDSIASGTGINERKERDVERGVWRRKEDDPYSRRDGNEGSRKRDHEDDLGSRQRGNMRESEIRSKDDQVSLRKHMDDGGLRNSYELDNRVSKKRKDEEYIRKSHSEKNEISYRQTESIRRLKQERSDKLEHKKRDVRHKIKDDFDDHSSLSHRGDFYMQRDGIERLRELENLDNLSLAHENGLSARGRERQDPVSSHRGSEDRSLRRDDYKASEKDHFFTDTTRHTKHTKRREYPAEESYFHHRAHEDFSARADDLVNKEKNPRQERSGAKSDKLFESSDDQRLQDRKHKDSRLKIKKERDGAELLRSKQMEQNGSSEVTGSKGTNEARNYRREIPLQPNASKTHKENASSGDELHGSKRRRTQLEHWETNKERADAVTAKSSSVSSKLQGKEKSNSGRVREPVLGSVDKNKNVTEEKSDHDHLAETKDGSEKGLGDHRQLDIVEKLKKRSERFKLPMPTEKDHTIVKKTESPSAKTEGNVNTEVKSDRPARKRRWTSS